MYTKKIILILLTFAVLACVSVGASAAADSSTIVQGEKFSLKGVATGSPVSVQWYLFGPNYFMTDTASVMDDGTYEITFSDTETKNMATGQYYLIIQHPMYDKTFNIGPVKTSDGYVIKVNNEGPYSDPSATELFNINNRQSTNAAEALERAIKNQNIDDMLTKISLLVTPALSNQAVTTTELYAGEILPVSGMTTGHRNDMVTVELASTAGFTPSSKDDPAVEDSYRIQTTRIGDSGAWAVGIDTTGLTPGTYWVTVTVGQLSPVTSTDPIQILAPATTEPSPVQPTQVPTQMPTPTPASPGFGILALLGLGGAFLLKRK